MRTGRAVLLAALGLLLLLAAIWIVPGMLDWNRYRASVAALVAAGIGRPVEIDGDITLHLLPQPILTASGLKVDDAGDGVRMTARELRLRVALGPLLGGRVDARELVLQGADLHLPWPPPAGALGRRPPAWLTALQARVEGSRLQVGDFVLSGLDAALGSDPDTGTLSAAGSAALLGHTWRFTARLGRPARDGAAPLDVSLDGRDRLRDTGGTFSGTLGADGALAGRITGRGPSLAELMPAPAVPWRGEGRLSAASGLAVADELSLEIGGSPARGAVALRVQPDLRLDLAIAAGKLDLDGWIPVLLARAGAAQPPPFPTGIDLSAEAATLAGGTLRQVRAAFDFEGDAIALREATAVLPGEAKLTALGRLPGQSRGTLFEGSAGLVAPDLRATLRWLEPVAPALLAGLPADALHAGDFTAKVAVDPAQLSLSELKGTLDGAALQGGLTVRVGKRPGVSAGMSLDRLLLDPWLPDPDSLADPAAAYARLGKALASSGFDADLKLQLRRAAWHGLDLGPVAMDVQSEAGRLTVRRLEAAVAGLRATVSGTYGDGGKISEGRVELTTQDVSPVRPYLPNEASGLSGLLRGPANLLLQVSGPPDALATRITLDLSDLRADAQPTLNLPGRRWAGPITLHHPGAPRLLELLDRPGTASWLGDGSFSLIAQASSAPGSLVLDDFQLVAGALRANGQLTLSGHALSGRARAETLPLPLPDPRSPTPLPFGWLRTGQANLRVEAGEVLVGLVPTVKDLSAELALADGTLRLSRISAAVDGGTLEGTVELGSGDVPRIALNGRAKAITIAGPLLGGALDVVGGNLEGHANLAAEGFSPAALIATLAGDGALTVANARANGFDLPSLGAALALPRGAAMADAVKTSLSAGATQFSELDLPFSVRRGVVSFDGKGTQGAASAEIAGTLDLSGAVLDGRLALRPGEALPEIAAGLSGPARAPVRTPELAGLARWLAERP